MKATCTRYMKLNVGEGLSRFGTAQLKFLPPPGLITGSQILGSFVKHASAGLEIIKL